jgi:hypothetical protein
VAGSFFVHAPACALDLHRGQLTGAACPRILAVDQRRIVPPDRSQNMIEKLKNLGKSLGIRGALRIVVAIIGVWYLSNGIYGVLMKG